MKPCTLCGSTRQKPVFSDWIRIVRCRQCGLVFQVLDSEALSALDEYYARRPTEAFLTWEGRVRRVRDIVEEIVDRYPGGRLLDVGSGNGEFLAAMESRGMRCAGLEPNVMQAEFSQRQGLNVVNAPLSEGLFPPESFDVVTLLQVLEHLPDPVWALRIVHSYLRPGGMVVIDVPSFNNPRVLLYRLIRIKRLVRKDFIRPHLFWYTPTTLRMIVEKSGFRVRKTVCGRYNIKFGPHPVLRLADHIANSLGVGGIVLYAEK